MCELAACGNVEVRQMSKFLQQFSAGFFRAGIRALAIFRGACSFKAIFVDLQQDNF